MQALGCLENGAGGGRHIRDVAAATGVPRPYLAKIFSALGRQGLVTGKRGYRGGVSLARPAERISLLEIVEAIEGPEWISPCLLNLAGCGAEKPCPTRQFWQRMRAEIIGELRRLTLAEMIRAQPAGNRSQGRRQFDSGNGRPREQGGETGTNGVRRRGAATV